MRAMSLLTWVSLAFLLVALVGSGVYLGLRALAAWRAFGGFSRTIADALEQVTRRAEAIEARVGSIAEETERLNEANHRLAQSVAELGKLREAAGEARGLLAGVRGAVPRK